MNPNSYGFVFTELAEQLSYDSPEEREAAIRRAREYSDKLDRELMDAIEGTK